MAKGTWGSKHEMEELVRENYAAIYRYCYWKVGNAADAQDITQESFLRFFEQLASYTNQGKPRALLYTIARNQCINWHKKARACPFGDAPPMAQTPAPNAYAELEERLLMQDYLSRLPPEQQEAVLLRYGQELQVNEIATIMQTSRFAVVHKLKRALATLKAAMQKEGFRLEESPKE